jgi:hypothetical protein
MEYYFQLCLYILLHKWNKLLLLHRISVLTVLKLHCPKLIQLVLSKSKLLYDWQYVLVSSTFVGLATRYNFLSEICGLVSMGRPFWREDGSAICDVITQWSELLRTRNHILFSHLRLPPTWRAGFPYLYPPGTGWPSYTPGLWVPFRSSFTTRRATVEVF